MTKASELTDTLQILVQDLIDESSKNRQALLEVKNLVSQWEGSTIPHLRRMNLKDREETLQACIEFLKAALKDV